MHEADAVLAATDRCIRRIARRWARSWTEDLVKFPGGAFLRVFRAVLRLPLRAPVLSAALASCFGMVLLSCGGGDGAAPTAIPPSTPATPPQPPDPAPDPPGACSNERELALEWDLNPLLPPEWNPDEPFRVWVDEEAIRTGGIRLGNPNFLEEQILEPLRVVADRIKDRLGYLIFDPEELLASESSEEPNLRVRSLEHLEPRDNNPWSPRCLPATHPPMSAWPAGGTVLLNDHFFDPAITCREFEEIRARRTIVHELAHVLGMKHAASFNDASSRQQGGIHMSESLTGSYFFSPNDILPEDIDALGCVYSHPDFPR